MMKIRSNHSDSFRMVFVNNFSLATYYVSDFLLATCSSFFCRNEFGWIWLWSSTRIRICFQNYRYFVRKRLGIDHYYRQRFASIYVFGRKSFWSPPRKAIPWNHISLIRKSLSEFNWLSLWGKILPRNYKSLIGFLYINHQYSLRY